MTEIKETILQKIANGEIDQKSKWYFLTRDYVLYGLTLATALLGAFACSALIFNVVENQLHTFSGVPWSRDYVWTVLETLPIVWVCLVVFLVLVSWLNYKHTTRSYKHHNLSIVLGVLLFALCGGLLLTRFHWGEIIEQKSRRHVPMYDQRAQYRDLKREMFLEKMPPHQKQRRLRSLNQELKNKGMVYVALHPHTMCRNMQYSCSPAQKQYRDRRGCGCRDI